MEDIIKTKRTVCRNCYEEGIYCKMLCKKCYMELYNQTLPEVHREASQRHYYKKSFGPHWKEARDLIFVTKAQLDKWRVKKPKNVIQPEKTYEE